MKISVILLNLGGPDRPEAIAPFLKNFFMDPAIIRAPYPVRFALSRLIAWRRSRGAAGSSYARLGGRSPLLDNTKIQARALEQSLNMRGDGNIYTVHIAMRYWHPMSDEVARAVRTGSPDHIVILPLYPQFSTTTTGSSFSAWRAAAARAGLEVPTSYICCYPRQAGWIKAGADRIREAINTLHCHSREGGNPSPINTKGAEWIPDSAVGASGMTKKEESENKNFRVLFSAHGLPEKIIRDGDPYQYQIEATAAAIVRELNIPDLDWAVCYQSRVGPMKWIGPSIEDELKRAAADKVGVVIYPIAFVSEHVETLVELDHEYREKALAWGVPVFVRAGTVMDHPDFIGGLTDMVTARLASTGIASDTTLCQCGSFKQCAMKE